MRTLAKEMIEQEALYRQYIQDVGVGSNNTKGSSVDSYLSRLRRISRLLDEKISPALLHSIEDVKRIADKLGEQIPQKPLGDCKTAMNRYVDMVRDRVLWPPARR